MNSSVTETINDFFAKYPKRHFDKGQIILLADENPQHIYHLESGRIRQYDITGKGHEIVLNIFKPPAFFPMNWALNQSPNLYFFQAEEDCEVRLAPPEDVVAFLHARPEIMFDLLQRVYRGTDGLLGRLAQLMAGNAVTRLVYELLIECRRFGRQQEDGSYQVAINEQKLGERAGLTRETINRELHHLKDEGIISVGRGSLTIHNLSKLEEKLRQE